MALKTSDPARLIDLSCLLMAVSAYQSMQGSDARVLTKGLHLVRRFGGALDQGLVDHIYRLQDAPEMRIKTRINMVERLRGPMESRIDDVADFLNILYPRLHRVPQVSDQIFTQRAATSVTQLAQVASEEDPVAKLKRLAALPSISALNTTRNWIIDAATQAGVAPSETETLIGELELAKDLGEAIKQKGQEAILAPMASPQAVAAEEEKADLIRTLEDTARQSQNPQAVMQAGASAATTEKYTQVTKMGAQLGLTRAQEAALSVRGKALIAAGAGSGKTRVLAGMVVDRVRDQKIPLGRVIASSFSAKSARELKKRITAYGTTVTAQDKNIGTTHSLGGSIIGDYLPHIDRKKIIQKGEETLLVQWAIAQVTMLPDNMRAQIPDPPPADQPFFPRISSGGVSSGGDPDNLMASPEFREAMGGLYSYWEYMDDKGFRVAQGYTDVRRMVGQTPYDILQWLGGLRTRMEANPVLSQGDKDALNALFAVSKSWGKPMTYRVASLRERGRQASLAYAVRASLRAADLAMTQDTLDFADHFAHVLDSGDFGDDEGLPSRTAARQDGEKESKEPPKLYFKSPLNQWFNLGWPAVTTTGVDKEGAPKQQKIGPKRFKTAFGKMIGDMESVGAVYAQHIKGQVINRGLPYAEPKKGLFRNRYGWEEPPPFQALVTAVYAAYQFIKGYDLGLKNRIDYSDMLVLPTALMIHDPKVRDEIQGKYHTILVDEAQDLNNLQHTMFGMVAGYLDHKTLKPKADGSMTADTFAFVGDDKQAIYAFRGADPDVFVSRSDLGDTPGDFTTVVLETNFRSGGMIVGAANDLIAHNVLVDPETGLEKKLQIPMVCNVKKASEGKGTIAAVPVKDPATAAKACAIQIKDMIDSGEGYGEDGDSPTFGIALRTNAEAYPYCVALIEEKLVFRTKIQIFGNPTTKGVLQWLQLASVTNLLEANDAVLSLHKTPDIKLGGEFERLLPNVAKGNYYDWLMSNWRSFPFKKTKGKNSEFLYESKIETLGLYVASLRKVREELSGLHPTDFLQAIFQLEGRDANFKPQSFEDSLIEKIRSNEEMMDSLSEESTDEMGAVADDAIRALAMAPVQILEVVLKNFLDIANGMAYIKQLEDINKSVGKIDEDGSNQTPAVLIGTAHMWKGLECEHLFTQMGEGMFPSAFAQDDLAVAQERRLAYVTITRGKETVTIYSPSESSIGKEMLPSRFIQEACIPGVPSFDQDAKERQEEEGDDIPSGRRSLQAAQRDLARLWFTEDVGV